jgi:hypothetical protein
MSITALKLRALFRLIAFQTSSTNGFGGTWHFLNKWTRNCVGFGLLTSAYKSTVYM